METSVLTFKLLDERIEALPEHPSNRVTPNRRARWGAALVAIAGTLALTLGKLLPPEPWTAVLVWTLVVIEVFGVVLAITADLSNLRLTFAHQRREYAEVLDFDMPHHEGLITWLCTFPRDRLQAMSEFAACRLERYRSKMPMLTGGIDKLGALPVLTALVIQFKDASWPSHVSLWQIALFVVLSFSYWLCLLAVLQRLRLELYDLLLKKALAQASAEHG